MNLSWIRLNQEWPATRTVIAVQANTLQVILGVAEEASPIWQDDNESVHLLKDDDIQRLRSTSARVAFQLRVTSGFWPSGHTD